MKTNRRQYLQSSAALALSALGGSLYPTAALAQSREKSLRHVLGATITSLDPTLQGTTRESPPISMCIYDRLARFGKKTVQGASMFDMDVIEGELAQKIEQSPDKRTTTFHLRPGAQWHDNSPVTIEDIKWSLDRGVEAQSLAKAQLEIGAVTKTEQIKVVGPNQIQIQIDRPERLAVATFCVPYLPMFNSKLAKQHATSDDPWAIGWLKENTAAGGAYMVESNRPGQQLVLKRNDKWKNSADGQLPFFERVIVQTIPDASARVNLLEKGDADISIDVAPSDIDGIKSRALAKIQSTSMFNAFQCISFNTQQAPFDDPHVRKAVAYALPYDDMFRAAQFGRGERLYGAEPKAKVGPEFPQVMPNQLDLEKARQELKLSGVGGGFKTTFSFPASVAPSVEPIAALIKENLAKISIDVTVQKLPDAQFTTAVVGRKLPMVFDFTTSYFPSPDYMARAFFMGKTRWNSSGWEDAEVAAAVAAARYEQVSAEYDKYILKIVRRFQEAQPVALLWHPAQDTVMAKNLAGYTYQFYRGIDYRDLKRV